MMTKLLTPPSELWTPAHYTKPLSSRTRGDDVIDFAELTMKAERGFRENEPLIFTDWQKWLLRALLETNENGLLRYRRALIGLPRKNGKSLLGTALALEHLFYGPEGAQIYSAASDRKQAKIVFDSARNQLLKNPALEKHVKIYRDAIENPKNGAIYRALSSDGNKAHGLGPSLAILDELHAWPSSPSNQRGDELYEALTSGSGDRPESMVVAITTAGKHVDHLLGQLYENGKKYSNGELENNQFGFFWWEAPQDADPRDPDVWKKANPNLAEGLLSVSEFEANIKEAEGTSFSSFQRLYLNQWVRSGGEDFINSSTWETAGVDSTIPLGAEVCLGFDGSISGDATGIVAIDIKTGILKVLSVWEPDSSDPDWTVNRGEVNVAMRQAFENYDVKLLWADPSFYEADMIEWASTWRGRVERIPPQSPSRMVGPVQQFLQDLHSGEIFHDKNPALTRHALNAVSTPVGTFKKEKPKSPRKVDLLMCAVLANGARHVVNKKSQSAQRSMRIL